MGSKMVIDRQKSSGTVQSAGSGYEEKMANSMAEIYGSEAGPAASTLIKLAVAKLKNDTEAMVRADDAHLKEVSDDSNLVSARDEKSEAVRAILVQLREAAETVYGPDFERALGFKDQTPSDPMAVQSLGKLVLSNLESGPALPQPVKLGLAMDLNAWKEPLSTGIEALSQAIQAVTDDKRDADQTLVAKREAMEKYDRTFSTTANLIAHMLRAAGEEELAKRVRPSNRKPGQTVEDSQEATQ